MTLPGAAKPNGDCVRSGQSTTDTLTSLKFFVNAFSKTTQVKMHNINLSKKKSSFLIYSGEKLNVKKIESMRAPIKSYAI